MKKVLLSTLFITLSLTPITAFGQGYRNDVTESLTTGAGRWGEWSDIVFCPSGSYAGGYDMRVESPKGGGDDTALNAISLYCYYPNGGFAGRIIAHKGNWGNWGAAVACNGSLLTSFRIKMEPWQRNGDDTAANSVSFICTNRNGYYPLEASNGGQWGNWLGWINPTQFSAICGFQAKVEPPQGSGDDTALNDLKFYYCRL
ncbi:hypothetical protein QUA07_25365 [Microcoleus sp. T3_A4]|uniref:hypothetical protein n=1 Tax=Microcoleus sp. T3_A4 TaxID=2818968 RepID=UPI002FD1ACCD